MAKKTNKTTIAGNFCGPEYLDAVEKSFDGLRNVVGKMPPSEEKSEILGWVGDTYIAASRTILTLVGGFAPNAHA